MRLAVASIFAAGVMAAGTAGYLANQETAAPRAVCANGICQIEGWHDIPDSWPCGVRHADTCYPHAPGERLEEDSPGWDCHTMGNRICGKE